ncbi:esterase-like activity of phytase family protein [Sphingomonas suaedae]|uniref:Esterase-like activity of phytase family protein n=1 Tax=Sphingomonas suaedae TaxID=2599297 RepID=A0A518RGG2_9SPHN|nr:esterase-like activity of phytase family protein [Sphingomonas suaedae]QDX26547.1 esterase-like activity of phytase family protein [Sphingomonas suaedae]
MRILLSVLLCLIFVPDWSGAVRLPLLPDTVEMTAEPVALDWRDPDRVRLGGLTFLGGVELRGPSPAFGGFSAMLVDGDRFTLLSDGGNLVSFRLDRAFRLSAPRVAALPDGPGRGWEKVDRDSESLTRDPHTGQIWVGFERANEIWRYSPGFTRAEAHAAPGAMADWPAHGGAEAMVRLRNGSFLLFAEDKMGKDHYTVQALWLARDPSIGGAQRGVRFTYRPPRPYKPTDMAELPDGRLIVLNRDVSLRAGFTAILTIVDPRAIRRGAIVEGQEIARFAAPVVHDNFEALAVTREGGDTILWIASDDNQWAVQRSLLLKFRLDI